MSKSHKNHVVLVAGSSVRAPKHKRSHTTPATKRVRFYLGVSAPSRQDYALQVMAGKAPVIGLDEVLTRFAPPQASIDKVTSWASETGHAVLGYDPFMRLVHVEHSAGGIRTVYGAKLSEYPDGKGGFYTARSNELHVPAEIAKFISGVHNLDQRPHANTKIRIGDLLIPAGGKKGKGGKRHAKPHADTVSWNGVTLAQHFGVHRTNLGKGAALGFFSLGGGLDMTVLANANKRLGLAASNWQFLFSDGATNQPNADGSLDGADGENYLDAQTQQAIAPLATLLCSFSTNTGVGIAHGYAALFQHASKPKNCSGSWGMAKDGWQQQDIDLTEETLAGGVAMGINICNAAGDDGSNDNVGDGKSHCDYPACSKFNSAGAGVFDDKTKVTVWGGVPNDGATGGGVDDTQGYTDQQLLLQKAGIKLPVNADSGKPGRIVGDIAGIADPQTPIEVMDGQGNVFGIGGTSAVSPATAGCCAATEADLGKALPNLNTVLYTAAANGKPICKPVTSGTNGAYSAKAGDVINCCGLGVIDYDALFQAVQAA